MDLEMRRRFFAEEVEAVGNIKTAAVVEALATVPRERFLRPGPWTIRSEMDFGAPFRATPDGDPRRVYHNYAIAIDESKQLFNGAPVLLAATIDALELTQGARVLHIGAGLGYYSAIIARACGETGRVLAIEVEEALASEARANLSSMPWVQVLCGNSTDLGGESFDAILVNAGITHLHDAWLDALAPGGRLIAPFTATMPAMGATIGKGVTVRIRRGAGDEFEARALTFVAIYSAVGLRDESANTDVGQALRRMPFPSLKRLRRDAHDPEPGCWLHRPGACLSQS